MNLTESSIRRGRDGFCIYQGCSFGAPYHTDERLRMQTILKNDSGSERTERYTRRQKLDLGRHLLCRYRVGQGFG